MENTKMTQTKQTERMYLTSAEAKAKGLPSAEEQIRRWNELQAQIRDGH